MASTFGRLAYVFIQIDQNMSNFYPLEVVGRGNEIQLQMGKKFGSKFSALMIKAGPSRCIRVVTVPIYQPIKQIIFNTWYLLPFL